MCIRDSWYYVRDLCKSVVLSSPSAVCVRFISDAVHFYFSYTTWILRTVCLWILVLLILFYYQYCLCLAWYLYKSYHLKASVNLSQVIGFKIKSRQAASLVCCPRTNRKTNKELKIKEFGKAISVSVSGHQVSVYRCVGWVIVRTLHVKRYEHTSAIWS